MQRVGFFKTEPIEAIEREEVLEAMKKIYKGKHLKQPDYLEVDAGSEFKDVFSQYFCGFYNTISITGHINRTICSLFQLFYLICICIVF